MPTVQVTENNFEATIKEGIVLLDFWASWCAPCRAFGPTFEAASARHPGVVFGKVDVEAEPGLGDALRISSIPTLMVLRDGVLLVRQPGALPGAALDEFIKAAQALDMDEVRKHILVPEPADGPAATEGVA